MNRQSANNAKDLVRNPYAFPGGYPRFAVCDDGAAMCHKCCHSEFRNIATAYESDGWNVVALDINWEDSDLYCDHCGEQIEPAYS